DLKRIALNVSCVQIGFHGKSPDDLAAALAHVAQREQVFLSQLDPELLAEFLAGNLFGIFTGNIFAFWNRPGSLVLVAPQRAAGMNEKHFNRSLPSSERNNSSACLRHDRSVGLSADCLAYRSLCNWSSARRKPWS